MQFIIRAEIQIIPWQVSYNIIPTSPISNIILKSLCNCNCTRFTNKKWITSSSSSSSSSTRHHQPPSPSAWPHLFIFHCNHGDGHREAIARLMWCWWYHRSDADKTRVNLMLVVWHIFRRNTCRSQLSWQVYNILNYNDVIMGPMASHITIVYSVGLSAGNSPGTGEFPAQMVSDSEDVSIWWHHHVENYCFVTIAVK